MSELNGRHSLEIRDKALLDTLEKRLTRMDASVDERVSKRVGVVEEMVKRLDPMPPVIKVQNVTSPEVNIHLEPVAAAIKQVGEMFVAVERDRLAALDKMTAALSKQLEMFGDLIQVLSHLPTAPAPVVNVAAAEPAQPTQVIVPEQPTPVVTVTESPQLVAVLQQLTALLSKPKASAGSLMIEFSDDGRTAVATRDA